MGKRDIRHRETRKPKKGSVKSTPATILNTPSTVEVIKKKRKKKEEQDF